MTYVPAQQRCVIQERQSEIDGFADDQYAIALANLLFHCFRWVVE
jgi:hypothetical protein